MSGSIAYDHLLNYPGKFKNVLQKENLENLSVSFSTNSHEVFFGGCGGNIAFSLKMFGIEPQLVGVAGNDFANYEEWFRENDISCAYVFIDPKSPTATASILTDETGNQIAFFAPGSQDLLIDKTLISERELNNIELAIISPDLPVRMMYVANFLNKLAVPYIFDPGQALSTLEAPEIRAMCDKAIGVIVNEYESSVLLGKLHLVEDDISRLTSFFIKTAGKDGCYLYADDSVVKIPSVSGKVIDPTGCGDCFRAGFIYGYLNDPEDLLSACKMGNVAASFALEKRGTQRHKFDLEKFENRLKKHF